MCFYPLYKIQYVQEKKVHGWTLRGKDYTPQICRFSLTGLLCWVCGRFVNTDKYQAILIMSGIQHLFTFWEKVISAGEPQGPNSPKTCPQLCVDFCLLLIDNIWIMYSLLMLNRFKTIQCNVLLSNYCTQASCCTIRMCKDFLKDDFQTQAWKKYPTLQLPLSISGECSLLKIT